MRSDIQDKFLLLEQRIQMLVSENARLSERAAALETECASMGDAMRELARLREQRDAVRTRVERILHSLETIQPHAEPATLDATADDHAPSIEP